MPNWCTGELTVTGDREELDKFRKHMGKEGLNADKVIPYPLEFKLKDKAAARYEKAHPGDWQGRPKDGFNQGGYDWCCENWGTKWGFCDVEVLTNKKDDYAEYAFSTAWGSITPVIKRMGKLFRKLKFSYAFKEEGMGFAGAFVIAKGKVVTDTIFDI